MGTFFYFDSHMESTPGPRPGEFLNPTGESGIHNQVFFVSINDVEAEQILPKTLKL